MFDKLRLKDYDLLQNLSDVNHPTTDGSDECSLVHDYFGLCININWNKLD